MTYATDPVYWALRQLRSERATDAIADAWECWSGSRPAAITTEQVWIRYRPFNKARVVLRVEVTPINEAPRQMDIMFSARASESAFKDDLAASPIIDSPPDVLPSFVIEAWRTIAWVLPYVPRPAALSKCMEPETIGVLLNTSNIEAIELLRYVPMRRALLRFSSNGQQYYAKIFDSAEQYRESAAALNVVADLPVRVPRLIASAPEMHTLVMDSLPGIPLSHYLLTGSLQPLADTGSALASIHLLGSVPEKIRLSSMELKDIEHLLLADLTLALPKLADRIKDLICTLADRLKSLGEVEPVAIHGKFFGDQVLFDPTEAPSIAIVDWDDFAGGDPHFDLGRLIAHILFESSMTLGADSSKRVTVLVDSYKRAGGVVDHERLQWHVVAALLLRVKISLLRTLVPGWETKLDAIVSQAEAVLTDYSVVVGTRLARGVG